MRTYLNKLFLTYIFCLTSFLLYADPWQRTTYQVYDEDNRSQLNLSFYSSYNTSRPFGYQDQDLWQGKGLNISQSITYSLTVEHFLFSIGGVLDISQNLSYDYSAVQNPENPFGYLVSSIDYPFRFGNSLFSYLGLKNSRIEYFNSPFFVGLGNENMQFGPASVNPLLLSMEAGGFPHFDFGINDWHTPLGTISSLILNGYLSESSFFDNDLSNDIRLISCFLFSYTPAIIPWFSFGIIRSAMTQLDDLNWKSFFLLLNLNLDGGKQENGLSLFGYDNSDQRVSLFIEFKFPEVGFRVYGEWARNDFVSNLVLLQQILEHSSAWVFGFENNNIPLGPGFLAFGAEWANTTVSDSYELAEWNPQAFLFYSHHFVRQGYTHSGQLLGGPVGGGGSFQMAFLAYEQSGWFGEINVFRHVKDFDYVLYLNRTTIADRKNISVDIGFDFSVSRDGPLGLLTVGLTYLYDPAFVWQPGNGLSNWRFSFQWQKKLFW